MPLTTGREWGGEVSPQAGACPHCGAPFPARPAWRGTGVDWQSEATLYGYPLVHIAFGRNAEGRLRVAKGVIAIGQFGIGAITIAQFGVGLLFGFGQFLVGLTALSQFAIALAFGVGQFATGYVAIGQLALGHYVLAQMGLGMHVWSVGHRDPVALEYFRQLAEKIGLRLPGR